METTLNVLDKVNNPADLRGLSIEEMNTLSAEMRELIIKKVNAIGGHLAPNLGFVEATIALHYVFNSPIDKVQKSIFFIVINWHNNIIIISQI